jgi:hypothetical protein
VFFCVKNIPQFLIKSKITYDETKQIVLEKLKEGFGEEVENELVIIEQATIRKEYGWIFFWTSKKHFETKDDNYALAGNTPFIVDNLTGELIVLDTAYDINFLIHIYRKYRNKLSEFDDHVFDSRFYPRCIWMILFGRILKPIIWRIQEHRWVNMK